MVVGVVAFGQYHFDGATIENDTARLTVTTPRGDVTPTKRVTIERDRAIKIRRRDKQMVEAIFGHSVTPSPNVGDNLPAAGQVDREV